MYLQSTYGRCIACVYSLSWGFSWIIIIITIAAIALTYNVHCTIWHGIKRHHVDCDCVVNIHIVAWRRDITLLLYSVLERDSESRLISSSSSPFSYTKYLDRPTYNSHHDKRQGENAIGLDFFIKQKTKKMLCSMSMGM